MFMCLLEKVSLVKQFLTLLNQRLRQNYNRRLDKDTAPHVLICEDFVPYSAHQVCGIYNQNTLCDTNLV